MTQSIIASKFSFCAICSESAANSSIGCSFLSARGTLNDHRVGIAELAPRGGLGDPNSCFYRKNTGVNFSLDERDVVVQQFAIETMTSEYGKISDAVFAKTAPPAAMSKTANAAER